MPKYRPNTPTSAPSSFNSQPSSSSRLPPPDSPSLHCAGQGPATPPEDPPDPAPPPLVELSAFFAEISAFLEGDYLREKTLTLTQVSPARLQKFQRWALNRRLHRLRYDYDAATRTLTLRGMITAVHSTLGEWLHETYWETSLSGAERAHIRLQTSRDTALRGGAIRQPDALFRYVFVDKKKGVKVPDPFPRVIFEVAFSQTYEDLKRVAERWLKGARGKVQVVVAVNIEEGARPNVTWPTENSAACTDQDDDGEHQGSESTESEPESEDFTSEDVMESFYRSCDPSDLVGPLTATIELFRRGEDGNMVRDGPSYRFLPDRCPDVDPVLKISDLLRDTSDDDHRTMALPLARYAELLNDAKRDLALVRKAMQKRDKRKRVEEGGEEGEDFVTDALEDEEERGAKRVRLLRSAAGGGRRGHVSS